MADLDLSLDRFVVGPENELAFRAARMVAEGPGTLYNPLLIQGPSGAGKTHLLRGMAAAAAADSAASIILEGAGALADRVTSAIATGTLSDLRSAFGGARMLLLDGVEDLASLDRTQEELVLVATDLLKRSGQLVFASTRPAGELSGIIPELNALLLRSVAIDIAPLGRDGLERLTRQLAAERELVLTDEVASAIASSSTDAGGVTRLIESLDRGSTPTLSDVYANLAGEEQPAGDDEFASFLSDISLSVSAVVETAPWRRRIVHSIVRWEAEGIDTSRLEQALDSDTAPDVDGLLESFDREAGRLLDIRRELGGHPLVSSFRRPEQLAAAESLLLGSRASASSPPQPSPEVPDEPTPRYPWFLDPARVDMGFVGVDERLAEGIR